MHGLTLEQIQQMAAEHGISEAEVLTFLEAIDQKQRAIAALEGCSWEEAGVLMIAHSRRQIQQFKDRWVEWEL